MSGPTRVSLPEIGPYLGRLTDATRRFDDPHLGLDAIRLAMVSDLFERTNAARGFLLTDDLEGARAALDRAGWLEVWRGAVAPVTDRTVATIRARIARAQGWSGCPDRLVGRRLPTSEDREILAAKLEAAGIPLEEQAGRGFPLGEGWWEAVRQSAVALEDSWEQLEEVVRRELRAAESNVAAIEAWRPSRVPWLVGLACLTLLAAWLGLALGGYLSRPAWLEGFHHWFWSLPWP